MAGAMFNNTAQQLYDIPEVVWQDMPPAPSLAPGEKWYATERDVVMKDGSRHRGELELITWESTCPITKKKLGWGGVWAEEADRLKELFETNVQGIESHVSPYFHGLDFVEAFEFERVPP